MREIKFRGRSLRTNEWVYGYYFEASDGAYILQLGATFYKGGLESLIEVAPATVGQYTGLKDKNEQDAYQSDVMMHKGRAFGVIEYHDYTGGWKLVGHNKGEYVAESNKEIMALLEIGGILYQNPELLK